MLYFFGLYVNSKVWSNTKLEFQEKFKFQTQKSDIDLEFWKKKLFAFIFFSKCNAPMRVSCSKNLQWILKNQLLVRSTSEEILNTFFIKLFWQHISVHPKIEITA